MARASISVFGVLVVGRIRESAGQPYRWPVTIIEAGQSKNPDFYSPELLKASAAKMEGRPAMAFLRLDADGNPLKFDHQANDSKVGYECLNQIGVFKEARWDPSEGPAGAIVADMVLLKGNGHAEEYQRHLESLEANNALDSLGLSINCSGRRGPFGVASIENVFSIDVVTHPAAGGQIGHRFAASYVPVLETPRMKTLFGELKVRFPRLCEGLTAADKESTVLQTFATRIKENEAAAAEVASLLQQDVARLQQADPNIIMDQLKKVMAFVKQVAGISEEAEPEGDPKAPAAPAEPVKAARPAAPAKPSTPALRITKAEKEADAILQNMRIRESRLWLQEACTTRKLSKESSTRLMESHKGIVFKDEAAADAVAKSEQDYVDSVLSAAHGLPVTRIRESRDKATDILHAMLSARFRESEAGKEARGEMRDLGWSLHRYLEAFAGIDIRKSGSQADKVRLKEAVNTTNFDEVFAEVLNRAILSEYRGLERYQTWRDISTIVPFTDFKTKRFLQLGYYGNLPTVAKAGTYLALTTPTDREETLAMAKKGGLESILWEDLRNDDLGVWQSMIKRIGRAAAETVYETVFSQLRIATQQTMSDTNALTAAGRTPANLLTVALSADAAGKTAFLNAVRQMMAQTGGSGTKKGIVPTSIIIPMELADAWAFIRKELVGGLTGVEAREALDALGAAIPKPIIDFGAALATDWFLHWNEVENIIVGFLDGRDEPEIFIADDERFGNLFTKDQIDLKVRQVVAAGAADWVGVQGNDVA